jgi:hypothetical protein
MSRWNSVSDLFKTAHYRLLLTGEQKFLTSFRSFGNPLKDRLLSKTRFRQGFSQILPGEVCLNTAIYIGRADLHFDLLRLRSYGLGALIGAMLSWPGVWPYPAVAYLSSRFCTFSITGQSTRRSAEWPRLRTMYGCVKFCSGCSLRLSSKLPIFSTASVARFSSF